MIAWAIEALVAASLLMLLVLAVRKPVAQLFGAEWSYTLWLLPLVLPFLPPLPFLAPMQMSEVTVILPAAEALSAPASDPEGSSHWLLLLLSLWAGGAVMFAVWQQSTYSAFMLHLGHGGAETKLHSFGGIRVVESEAVDGPIAVGIFNRRIVVPLDFSTRYSAVEQRLALEHELIHHRRFDLFWNCIALGMLTFNWFNPIAHIAFRAFRADQELACDAAVARRSPTERHDYARALVKSASQPGLIAVCPLNHADFLKRRLKMMKTHRASRARSVGGAASVLLLAAAGVAATPGFAHREQSAPPKVLLSGLAGEAAIAPVELARLRDKCGAGGGGAIVCSGDEAKDPEVRAIVAKTSAKPKAAKKRKNPVLAAAIEAEARAAIAKDESASPIELASVAIEVTKTTDQVREEVAQAVRASPVVRIAVTHADAKAHATGAAFTRRYRVLHVPGQVFGPGAIPPIPDKALIEQAVLDAHRQLATIEFRREMKLLRLELQRELEAVPEVH